MSLRTTAQLAQDFPVSSTKLLLSSIKKFDELVDQGFLGDVAELQQIAGSLFAGVNALAETFGPPTAAFTGTAGDVTRAYLVVPTYPLPYGVGGAQNANGRYLNFLGGKPPYGYPQASASSVATDGVRRVYGKPSAAASVGSTAAVLDADNFVTITTPAAAVIPGLLFDIVAQNGTGPFTYAVVAIGIAPGANYVDSGSASAQTTYAGGTYVPRPFAEVGRDPANGGTLVYGPLTR